MDAVDSFDTHQCRQKEIYLRSRPFSLKSPMKTILCQEKRKFDTSGGHFSRVSLTFKNTITVSVCVTTKSLLQCIRTIMYR